MLMESTRLCLLVAYKPTLHGICIRYDREIIQLPFPPNEHSAIVTIVDPTTVTFYAFKLIKSAIFYENLYCEQLYFSKYIVETRNEKNYYTDKRENKQELLEVNFLSETDF